MSMPAVTHSAVEIDGKQGGVYWLTEHVDRGDEDDGFMIWSLVVAVFLN